jgi:hypothetical protein
VLPACLAWIEQVPTATSVTVFSETVHTAVVLDAKLTGSPEVAVALTVYGPLRSALFGRAPNLMVWLA